MEIDGTFTVLEPELRGLDGYAIRTRYPGQNANKDEALAATKIVISVRGFIRRKFGLNL